MRMTYIELLIKKLTRDFSFRHVLVVGDSVSTVIDELRKHGLKAEGLLIGGENPPFLYSEAHKYKQDTYDLVILVNLYSVESLITLYENLDRLLGSSDEFVVVLWVVDAGDDGFLPMYGPGWWTKAFFDSGYSRDLQFELPFTEELSEEFSFGVPWIARFTQDHPEISTGDLVAYYEASLWESEQEAWIRHSLNSQYCQELTYLRSRMNDVEGDLIAWRKRWSALEQSIGWDFLKCLQALRAWVAPPESLRDQFIDEIWFVLNQSQKIDVSEKIKHLCYEIAWFARSFFWKLGLHRKKPLHHEFIEVEPVETDVKSSATHSMVDIVVCVHNALDDVTRCLESLMINTSLPYRIILVDDGSDKLTQAYLQSFSQAHSNVSLIRNDEARGYTRAANKGLRRSKAEYVVLLNSDTIVTSKWLSGLIACAKSDPRIGMVGPLSNTASWQSVPELAEDGDWASNQLPGGVSIEEMGRLVREFSSRLYPIVPLLNGFCLLIKRKLIDEIGFLDEVVFGDGYGEEDDYALRAGYVDWRLAIADDVYIYHAQSRSYTDEKRRRLSARAFDQLNRKHGQALVAKKVDICENSLILEGIRARTRAAFERRQYQQKGHLHFAKKRILFVLPVNQPGGGANVVVYEAEALNRMGIEVRIFNLSRNKDAFESMYPRLSIPVIYGRIQDLSTYSRNYDAVIATYNISVQWLADIEVNDGKPVRAYYVQGYEPYIYPIDSEAFFRAKRSYDLFENLIRFTKTEWTRREVKDKVGVDSSVVGVSADIDLFRPRKHGLSDHPIKVAAMIRPDSAYRSPRMTMEILKQASIRYGRNIEVVIFGTTKDNPEFTALSLDFPWKLAGILSTRQVANLLADIDIFVDFSQHQAMGLTALEAMACGAAVIVPERGGATAFSRHEHNSLVVNTDSQARCWQALCRLIEDHTLRSEIRRNALRDVTEYYPERVAFRIVEILFDRKIGDCGIGQT